MLLLWVPTLAWLGSSFCYALVWYSSQRQWRRAASYAVAIGAYAALWGGLGARHLQRVGEWERFLMEYPFHAPDAASRLPDADGWIRYSWSERGFAGMNNFDYFVLDRDGRFSAEAQRTHPDGEFGLACPVVAVRPMLGQWRIVTTYNCTPWRRAGRRWRGPVLVRAARRSISGIRREAARPTGHRRRLARGGGHATAPRPTAARTSRVNNRGGDGIEWT